MSLNDVTPDFLLKVIVIGDSGVGKSNLLTRWHSNTFQPISTPTIGVEFFTKTLKISTSSPIGNETKNRDYFVKVQVWDTAGQEQYRAMTSSYYRGAHGVLLVYDMTNIKSFENVHKWLDDVFLNSTNTLSERTNGPQTLPKGNEHGETENPIDVILIGNKCDSESERAVSTKDATDYAKKNKLLFMETSGKTGVHVKQAFNMLVTKIMNRMVKNINLAGKENYTVNLINNQIKNGQNHADETKECC